MNNSRINPVAFSGYFAYRRAVYAAKAVIASRELAVKPKKPRGRPRVLFEDEVAVPVVRPKAVYSNRSPYGIASALMAGEDV